MLYSAGATIIHCKHHNSYYCVETIKAAFCRTNRKKKKKWKTEINERKKTTRRKQNHVWNGIQPLIIHATHETHCRITVCLNYTKNRTKKKTKSQIIKYSVWHIHKATYNIVQYFDFVDSPKLPMYRGNHLPNRNGQWFCVLSRYDARRRRHPGQHKPLTINST